MSKDVFISDFKKGDYINSQAFGVSDLKSAKDKNGNLYYDIELIDKTGNIKGKIWNEGLRSIGSINFEAGDLCLITGSVSEYRGTLQLTVVDVEKTLQNKYDLSDFVISPEKPINEIQKEIYKYIKKIQDKDVKSLIKGLIDEYSEDFFYASAAKSNHHHYSGGLAEHVLEMLEISEPVLKIYKEVNKDLVIAGILMHDFGKIVEMQMQGFAVNYTKEGKLKGHIIIALELIDKFIYENKKNFGKLINSDKLMLIKHIILSHHGILEYGSPVIPLSIEAEIVSKLDDLSSKVRIYDKVLKANSKTDEDFAKPDYAINNASVFLRTSQAFSQKLNNSELDKKDKSQSISQKQKNKIKKNLSKQQDSLL